MKSERKDRRLKIMRYLGLAPPVGSPFWSWSLSNEYIKWLRPNSSCCFSLFVINHNNVNAYFRNLLSSLFFLCVYNGINGVWTYEFVQTTQVPHYSNLHHHSNLLLLLAISFAPLFRDCLVSFISLLSVKTIWQFGGISD